MNITALRPICLISILLQFTPTLAFADGPFFSTEYECKQLNAEHDGLTCFVTKDTSEPWLVIRLYLTPDMPKDKKERAKYLIDTLTHNFVARGGRTIQERKRFAKQGNARYEMMCYPDRATRAVGCYGWEPATHTWE